MQIFKVNVLWGIYLWNGLKMFTAKKLYESVFKKVYRFGSYYFNVQIQSKVKQKL